MFLGIELNTHLVFESPNSSAGRGLQPLPVITPAVIDIGAKGDPIEQLPDQSTPLLYNSPILFREDFFDPVSRIRRGRFYKRNVNSIELQWEVDPTPAQSSHISVLGDRYNNHTGRLRTTLLTFQSFPLRLDFPALQNATRAVVLGTRQSPTFWKIIDIETISTGEELVTLKSRTWFGVLPELNTDKILDESDRAKVVETIERLADTIYRAGPESVIDRARDAASAIMLAALRQEGAKVRAKDLSDAIKRFEKHNKLKKLQILQNAARIIARLHSRAKPSEQERSSPPNVCEQDGELAVLSVGTILRDLGWANWL